MRLMRVDNYVARVCDAAENGETGRFTSLLSNPELIELDDGVYILVGTARGHNVACFIAPSLPDRVSFKEMMQGIKDSMLSKEDNPYQIPEALMARWAQVSPEAFAAINTVHYGQAETDGITLPWTFTGYGGGGALAQLAAAAFKPARLITFGAPDAGGELLNEKIADACDWRRWEFMSDWNAKLPVRKFMSEVSGCTMFIDDAGVLETDAEFKFRRISDWFERTPMSAYMDWLEGEGE